MKSNIEQPLHALAKFEYQVRFFYFLRDLGIKSADQAAKAACHSYIEMLTHIMSSEQ